MRPSSRPTEKTPVPEGGATLPRADVLDALASPRRRLVLSILTDRQGAITTDALVRAVLDREYENPRIAAPDEARRRVDVDLHHRHLPKLDAVNLVSWDRDESEVTLGECPAIESPAFRAATATATAGHDQTWDEVLPTLGDPRRRAIVETLAGRVRSASPTELAEALQIHERTDPGTLGGASGVESTAATVRHVDLPALANVGLVEFEPDGGVTLCENPALAWVLADDAQREGRASTGRTDGA